MTIYTTEGSAHIDEKKAPLNPETDVEIVIDEKRFLTTVDDDDFIVYRDPVAPLRRPARKTNPKRVAFHACLVFGMIFGVLICVSSSLYLYRRMYEYRYFSCSVVVPTNWSRQVEDVDYLNDYEDAPDGYFRFEDDFEIDDDSWTSTVPQYGVDRPATFVHDFHMNFTAILDGIRCIVFDLKRDVVPDPESMRSELTDRKKREYSVANSEVQGNYMVYDMDVEMGSLGNIIPEKCRDRNMHWAREFEYENEWYPSSTAATTEGFGYADMQDELASMLEFREFMPSGFGDMMYMYNVTLPVV